MKYIDGPYLLCTSDNEGYFKLLITDKNIPTQIIVVRKQGNKFRVIGGSDINPQGNYQLVYDVQFGKGGFEPGSGSAMIMEEGEIGLNSRGWTINGTSTQLTEISFIN